MTVLSPKFSDATSGTKAPLHVPYKDKMSSSHISEELRVCLAAYPTFGWEYSTSEVSGKFKIPVNAVPAVLLKRTEVTDDCGRTSSCE